MGWAYERVRTCCPGIACAGPLPPPAFIAVPLKDPSSLCRLGDGAVSADVGDCGRAGPFMSIDEPSLCICCVCCIICMRAVCICCICCGVLGNGQHHRRLLLYCPVSNVDALYSRVGDPLTTLLLLLLLLLMVLHHHSLGHIA